MIPTQSQEKTNNRLYTLQEIERICQASAAQPDLFDHLLEEKEEMADAESTAKMEESRMD